METEPLTERELKRLAKMDRKLARGRLRFGLFGAGIGFLGGLAWVLLMWLMLPGFGSNMHVAVPTGREAHPVLEQVFYWLAIHFGAVPAICILAGSLFGGGFGLLSLGALWRVLVKNHAALARRAIACAQFTPAFASPLLRRAASRPS